MELLTGATAAQAATIAVETIALIEAIKNFFKKNQKQAPAWVYTLLSFIFCFGLAFLKAASFTTSAILAQAEVGLLALAFAQLCYDSIWKGLQTALKKINGTTQEPEADTQGGGENE
jgi:hypothetical protein